MRRSYESHVISEEELRERMRQYLDALDMPRLMGVVIEQLMQCCPAQAAIFVESAASDLEEMKSGMYRVVREMDLSMEMRLNSRVKSGLQALAELRLHHENCSNHVLNGLQLHNALALETEELIPLHVLRPIKTKLAEIVILRLQNAINLLVNDMYKERCSALEVFREFNNLDFGRNFLSSMHEVRLPELAAQKAEGDCLRAAFLEKAKLKQPQTLRLININASCQCGKVVLEDFEGESYSAISHTYGMDVYEVFDCECACLCLAQVPRCSTRICGPDAAHADESVAKHRRVVEDILYMCRILQDAGVEFAWHDGVCIAQHDKREVEETVKCMGWIYSNAAETIVFLHYVGKPIAPISNDPEQLTCRWHTRVWTVQEIALSRSRRYCVRTGDSLLRGCTTLQEFEEKVGTIWNRVEVITEEKFIVMVRDICAVLNPLFMRFAETFNREETPMYEKALKWIGCILPLGVCLQRLGLEFPTRLIDVLRACSYRESKHEGDRMNSVLAFAGLKDFVAPKDEDVEEWTLKFFRMQGQQGLAIALFSINAFAPEMNIKEDRRHTWAPSLSHLFLDTENRSWKDWDELEWTVDEESGGNLVLTGGHLVCVAITFTLKAENQSNWSLSELGAPSFHHSELMAQNTAVIDMELTRIVGLGRYGCAFAQAPHLVVGCVLLQVVIRSPGTYPVVDEGVRHIRAEGDSFEAHLVLPLHTITMAFQEHSAKPSSSHSPPSIVAKIGDPLGLLVQGELPTVSKIGLFTPSNRLLLQLMPMLESPSVTILSQLVIK